MVFAGFDEAADLGNFTGILFGKRRLVRFAAFAGTESSSFGGLRGEVELNIFRAREAGGAGWAAIDAGGFNGVEEGAIGGRVAGDDGLVARVGCCGGSHEDNLAVPGAGRTPVLAFELIMSGIWISDGAKRKVKTSLGLRQGPPSLAVFGDRILQSPF